jgi:FG-GAP repeat
MQTGHVRSLIAVFVLGIWSCRATERVKVDSRSEVVAEITGANAFEWAGLSVTDIGDVNGDGKADVAVGALAAPAGGQVGIFFGPIVGEIPLKAADVLFTGEFTFSNAGQALNHAGHCDVDGDGFDDILIGAPFADRFRIVTAANVSGDNAGRAYLVFGGPALSADIGGARSDVIFLGEHEYDGAGFTVGCAGDLDGDGKSDLAISAPRAPNGEIRGAGVTYLIYGRDRAGFPKSFPLENADAMLMGEKAFDNAGSLVAVAGDLDGDMLAELAVSAPGADEGGLDSGTVYLVKGQRTRLSGKVMLAQMPHLFGNKAGQRLGLSLSALGDFNGDGKSDLAVGGSPVADALAMPGQAFVVMGGELPTNQPVDSKAMVVEGLPGDAAGIGLAALGDITGDGFADFAVGASLAKGSDTNSGAVYFVQGGPVRDSRRLELQSTFVALSGQGRNAYAGEVLQRAGDVNGDGVNDLLVAARGTAHGNDGAGSVYVVSGKALAGK